MPRNTGKTAESIIEYILRNMERRGEAWARHTHPSIVTDKFGRKFYRDPGAPDYVGCIKGGRMWLFDVKSTTQDAWGPGKGSRTLERQLSDIEAAGALGALSGLLLVFLAYSPMQLLWVPHQNVRKLLGHIWTPTKMLESTGGAVAWDWHGPKGWGPNLIEGARELDSRLAHRFEGASGFHSQDRNRNFRLRLNTDDLVQ